MTRAARYREVDAATLPPRHRQAAENAVRFASVDLAIGVPEIRYFTDCGPTSAEFLAGMGGGNMPPPPSGSFEHERPILGKAGRDDVVWLRADVGARRLAEIAFHETLHVWQRREIGPAQGPYEFDGREAQARQYETDLRGIAASIVNATKGVPQDA